MTDPEASIFSALKDEREKERKGGGGGKPKHKLTDKSRPLRIRRISTTVRYNKGQRLARSRINNVVKARYVPNNSDATRHIIQHTDYILKREREPEEPERKFFNRNRDNISRDEVIDTMLENKGKAAMFKLIFSPNQNELNHEEFIREVMARWELETGIVSDWYGVKHANTAHHHVHLEMPGKDVNGKDIIMTPELLDAFREIANQHQYELQRIDYEWERGVQDEFNRGALYEEALRIWEYQNGRELMRELGVTSPELDKATRELLGPPISFDPVQFRNELQRELLQKAFQLEKLLNPEKYPDDPYRLTSEQHKYYVELFKQLHPDLCQKDYRGEILKDREADLVEKHPELAARYSPEAEPYYLEKLEQHLDEHPEDADKYTIDPTDPEKTAENVIKQYLADHPQLAPELAMEPDKPPEPPQQERDWKIEDIDLDKIPADQKIIVRDETFTKYHSSEDLRKLDEHLKANYEDRIPRDQYSMLGTWLTAKEHRGEDVYGRPPCKGDPERDPDKEAIDGLTRQIKDYNEKYVQLVPRFKNNPIEFLSQQIEKSDEWYPTTLAHFKHDLKEYLTGILDEFPEFLPGHEDELAKSLYDLHKATEQDLDREQEIGSDDSKPREEDPEKHDRESYDFSRDDTRTRLLAAIYGEDSEREPDETVKALLHIVNTKEIDLEHMDPSDLTHNQREILEQLLEKVAIDTHFVEEVKDIDPKELLWKLNEGDQEHQYEEDQALADKEHFEALLDQTYAPHDEQPGHETFDDEGVKRDEEDRERDDDDDEHGRSRGNR